VHTTLLETIAREKLDAITVGCFDLVRKHEVTACLSLAHLSDQGIAAGCEGDTCSAAAMMFAKAICGIIPWMANVAMVSANMLRLAHCTTPTLLLSEFEVDTHYETGLGTAIAGKFAGEDITIFRFDKELQKAFITQGKITSTHKRLHACRTQIEVAINEQDALLLRENPLGNHHLVLPGKNAAMLADACALCGIQLVS
jgi:L-fucose isomerase-like protein